tara:strand:+ start:855 stop:1094 length:240 start_codon:yes stop_codon:yes gene_type:complete
MEFFNSKKFILLIVVILVVGGLTGCAKKHVEMDHPKQPTTLETIGKLDAIANVLGCMFDPTPCQKKSEEQKNVKPESQE